jgi:hypothetical protein
MRPKKQQKPPPPAVKDSEDADCFVKLKKLQDLDQWTCTSCKGSFFSKLNTAHKHVSKEHPGEKARSRPIKTGLKLLEYKRKVSVQTSRRHLVKERMSILQSLPSFDEGRKPSTKFAEPPRLNALSENGQNAYGIFTCTALARRGATPERCRMKSINSGEDSSLRR